MGRRTSSMISAGRVWARRARAILGVNGTVSLALLSASLIAGCATLGTIQTAETLGKDNSQYALESSTWGGIGQKNSPFNSSSFAVPNTNFSARYGVTDGFDLGARIGSSGLEITTKFQLTDPKQKAATVFSIAPSVGGLVVSTDGAAGSVYGQLPLLIGFRIGEGSELILGPKIHDWVVFYSSSNSSDAHNLFSVGSSIGLALRLGKTFRLLPEISVLYPLSGSLFGLAGASGRVAGGAGVLYQGTLGFLFGG